MLGLPLHARARPNLVIIMADDMGYGDAGCYGGSIATPNLDRMAAEGMRFTDFHSSGNVCSPTRAGLLTGRYQQRAGIPGVINADPNVAAHHHGLVPEKEVTFAELLHNAGYTTAIFGKWHLGYTRQFNPVHHGFDRFRGFVSGNIDYHSHYDRMEKYDWWDGLTLIQEEGYSTHLITQHAVTFIEENRDQPFCLYVAHEAVHSPWQGPNDPPQRGPDKQPRPGEKGAKERAFKEMLTEMDKGVGEILDALKALELAGKTFVFFLSDNGPAGGSAGPLRGRKGSNWEGGHRVPAIAWWPGTIPAGETSDQLAVSLDLMPTLLALAGTRAPEGHRFDGMDLTPVLTRGETIPGRQLVWNGRAMRDGVWKLIRSGKGTEKGSIGLYNLSQDIGERNNLAQQHPERVTAMLRGIEAWNVDVTRNATPQSEVQDETGRDDPTRAY
jgi:arylsulfatase A-like enzyme